MAAYIGLNSDRSGMVEDLVAYRWCGYAEAVAGGQIARKGLMRVLSKLDSDTSKDCWGGAADLRKYDWRSVSVSYLIMFF